MTSEMLWNCTRKATQTPQCGSKNCSGGWIRPLENLHLSVTVRRTKAEFFMLNRNEPCLSSTYKDAVVALSSFCLPWAYFNNANQRWSRGHKARGQGQGHKKIRGQEQPFRGQTLSRPRTGLLEAKAKDQGHKRKCSSKKSPHKNFSGDLHKKRFPKKFSGASRNFNNSKNSAVLESRAGQFSRTWGQGLDLRGQGQGLQNVSSRTSSRTPPLMLMI